MKNKQTSPPKLFQSFFRWFCNPRILDYIEGDLLEEYDRRLKESGKRKADWKFILDVMLLFRPGIIKSRKGYKKLNNYVVYKSYFKIGWRTLIRNKQYAVINIAGLALSLTCCFLIFGLVTHHLSFEDFHKNPEQIYRVVTDMQSKTDSYSSGVPTPLAGLIRENQTFATKIARIYTESNVVITLKQENETLQYKETDGVAFTEPEFFEIFNFPLAKGDGSSLLTTPNTALLTEQMAKKYFGEQDPIGETIWLGNEQALKITGLLKDFPDNTDFRAGIFASYSSFKTYMPWLASENFWSGISSNMQCFALIDPTVTSAQVEQSLAYYAKEYPISDDTKSSYKVQPLADIHFNGKYGGTMDRSNLWILAAIGLFLLLTACVNFVNLATAKALQRSKEVGLRKVMGGKRSELFWQFIFETGILVSLSIIMALIASFALLPTINSLFNTQIILQLFSDLSFVLFLVGLTISITLLAGFYPALILAGFKPIAALKGKLSLQQLGGFNIRRSLIISQFVISQVLIISLLVVMEQMRFARNADMGFDKEAIVMVNMGNDSLHLKHALKNEFMRIPGVEKVALCYNAPASKYAWGTDIQLTKSTQEYDFLTSMKLVDEDYLATFDLQLLAGRNLTPSDTVREVLVNEALLEKLGINSIEGALGQTIAVNGGNMRGPIVGVIKNFHDKSFHEEISPTVLTSAGSFYENFAIKLNPNTGKESLIQIEQIWKKNYPDQLFEFEFLDDSIARFYETEEMIFKGVQLFSFIAIVIGCFGLYGLISFMVVQKTKEVGIRKVMGSGVGHIVWIFGKEFTRLIILSFLIAAPIAWYLMRNWLQDFEFKIQLDVWTFGLALTFSFMIAILTVGIQVIKAANINPVRSLKTE